MAMRQVLHEASIEEWIEFVFARPVTDPAWFWEADADLWEGDAFRTAGLLVETFERSGELLEPFDDEQVNQGLSMLLHAGAPTALSVLASPELTPALRERVFESVFRLFEDVFAVRCSNALGHLDEESASPLNSLCYLWWDVFPVRPEHEFTGVDPAHEIVLGLLDRILDLPSDACRESALHGCARWQAPYPERVGESIDRFIWANRQIRTPLRNYAYAARHGDVP